MANMIIIVVVVVLVVVLVVKVELIVVKVKLVLVLVLVVKVVLVLVHVLHERSHTRPLDASVRCCIHLVTPTAAVLPVASRQHITPPPARPEHFGSACNETATTDTLA